MSEDCITIHTNAKRSLSQKKIDELNRLMLEKVITSEPLDGNCKYDNKKKTLSACGNLKSPLPDNADLLLKCVKKITNTDPYVEIYFESTNEIQWHATIGDKSQTFDSIDELTSSIDNFNKICNIYPNKELEDKFESNKSINILFRYEYKAKKRLNAAAEILQTAIDNPSTENLRAICNNTFRDEYFVSYEEVLKCLSFVNIDKQFLYAGIDLDDTRNINVNYDIYDLFLLTYPHESNTDRMMLRSRDNERELHYFLAEGEPFYNSRKRRSKDEWEPINKWKREID